MDSLVNKVLTSDTSKIFIVYFTLLLLVYNVHSNLNRFLTLILFYIFTTRLFNINFNLGFLYFLIGIAAAFTEHIFIKYINESWDYRNPNFFTIPLWLIPLWGIAILLIIETVSIFTKN